MHFQEEGEGGRNTWYLMSALLQARVTWPVCFAYLYFFADDYHD